MKEKQHSVIWIIFFLFLIAGVCHSQGSWDKTWRGGITAGVGLPKMPLSTFRNPISIMGGGFVNYRMAHSFLLQVEGYGLYTFNFGTVDNSDGTLRYNMVWTSLTAMKGVQGPGRHETFIAVGVGGYHLNQQFNAKKDDINTAGINIGLINWWPMRRIPFVADFRWHLLFKPDPNPQVFMIHFGFLL